LTIQKYYLCQVSVVEMQHFSQDIKLAYTFNFATDTTKELNYHMS